MRLYKATWEGGSWRGKALVKASSIEEVRDLIVAEVEFEVLNRVREDISVEISRDRGILSFDSGDYD